MVVLSAMNWGSAQLISQVHLETPQLRKNKRGTTCYRCGCKCHYKTECPGRPSLEEPEDKSENVMLKKKPSRKSVVKTTVAVDERAKDPSVPEKQVAADTESGVIHNLEPKMVRAGLVMCCFPSSLLLELGSLLFLRKQ